MAGGGEDKHSKKHPASAKKKKDLKKKGTVPKSQDVPMALGLAAAFGAMLGMKGMLTSRLQAMMSGDESYFAAIKDVGTPEGIDVKALAIRVLVDVAMVSGPILFAVLVAALIANIAQTGLIITGEQMKPNLNKINPKNKFKQWFSIKSAQELAKSLGKILLASFLGFLVLKGSMGAISESVAIDVTSGCEGSQQCALALMTLGASIIKKLFIFVIILYVVIALIDYGFQRKNFETEHKMTDKEVKDEYKNSEGDPYQKGKRRQMAQEIAMNTSQEHVPQGDVVVVNPTELAICLKYDAEVSPVPWVLAKGEVHDADAIREAAGKAGVPVVRNKPLARALYELCEIGDIVPEELYRPVAEVLAYVFQLREQQMANANQAAQASHAALHANDAAAASQSLEPGADGVHDLGAVTVPVDPAAAAARAAAAAGTNEVPVSATAAGVVLPTGGSKTDAPAVGAGASPGTHASWGLAAHQPEQPQRGAAGGSTGTWGAASAAAPAAATPAGTDGHTSGDDDRYSWR
ncbi:MAG: EscU/YscU/HrcU family type III secretion system export apparatus switch protein [Thermoleophilia bacterium]|nr:EscU/YscU/HrcU family type III secretion system export apparatus switch protein [Thermoleophilia bacterium]